MKAYEYVEKYNYEYREFKEEFAKYGISIVEMAAMQEAIDNGKCRLVCTREMFHKTAGGNWQKKPFETSTEEFNAKNYMNMITSIGLFNDRVTKSDTEYGCIPVKLSRTSLEKASIKIKRTFKFESL